MEIESPSFTEQDLRDFFGEVRNYEDARPLDGLTVVERLEASLGRLEELVTFMGVLPPPEQTEQTARDWTPREVLAHIVLFSQVLGWGMWAIGSGEQDEISLMSFLILRDGAPLGKVPEKPIGRYGRALFQTMSYHDTPEKPLPKPSKEPPRTLAR